MGKEWGSYGVGASAANIHMSLLMQYLYGRDGEESKVLKNVLYQTDSVGCVKKIVTNLAMPGSNGQKDLNCLERAQAKVLKK